jgi:ankyrin repeat protein
MSFTTQLLKGCVMSDIVNVVNRYLVPKNPTFKQLCSIGLVEQLLIYCLNNKLKSNDGLNYACQGGNLEIVKLMIKKGANIWNWGLEGACEGGHLEIVNLMIEKGANDWNNGLYGACKGGKLEMVNLMNEKGANNWNIGLFGACKDGQLEMVNLMIEKGATYCGKCNNNWF